MITRYDIERWLYNLTVIRVLPIPEEFDLDRGLKWWEFVYCAPRIWPMLFHAFRRSESIPAGVVLVGAPLTRADDEWADEIAKRFGVGIPRGPTPPPAEPAASTSSE